CVLALLFLPRLGVSDEEALIAGQTLDHRRLTMLGRVLLVRGVGVLDTRKVTDILAERQLAVKREVRERFEAVVLRNERIGLRCEGLCCLGGPPIAQLALGVEL